MMNIFEVNVTTLTETTSTLIYGLTAAVGHAAHAAQCENVKTVDVIDQMTGEVMFLVQDGVVTWVSGIGIPCALGVGE
jgi:hypothetical protein